FSGSDGLAARLAALRGATDAGCDWTMFLTSGASLAEDALELMEPGLALHDAIFRAAHLAGRREAGVRLATLAVDEPERLPHALLNWWLPDSHLVRTGIAAEVLGRIGGEHWRLDYLFDLWGRHRCMKSAQPLLDVTAEPAPLPAQEREEVLRRLDE